MGQLNQTYNVLISLKSRSSFAKLDPNPNLLKQQDPDPQEMNADP